MLASELCPGHGGGADGAEIAPGELVAIDAHGVRSQRLAASSRRQALCIFEYIYLARTDSVISGQLVNETRIRMGRQLALEHPVEADLVIAVPLSAIVAGHGYAEQAGLPYRDGLASNRYIHRTFIQPDESMTSARLKYNPFRTSSTASAWWWWTTASCGTSQEQIVGLLRRAGAREVHLRICAPPLRHPCFLGVDMATYGELIAHRLPDVEAIKERVGADPGVLEPGGGLPGGRARSAGLLHRLLLRGLPGAGAVNLERANPKLRLEAERPPGRHPLRAEFPRP